MKEESGRAPQAHSEHKPDAGSLPQVAQLAGPSSPRGPRATVYLSRRDFLKTLAGAVAGASVLAACGPSDAPENPGVSGTRVPNAAQYPDVPRAEDIPQGVEVLLALEPHEAETVEDLTARLMPGSPDDPGAREAGVTIFIDRALAWNDGFTEPAYMQPPFAQTYEGDQPPANAESDPQVVWVAKDQLDRYGWQSQLTPLEMYQKGLASVDQYANQQYGSDYVDLSEEEQDQILADMQDGSATGFDSPTAKTFFDLLRTHTIQGMFADPAYGGNRDMVGWRLVGYPGAQRAYTLADFHTEGPVRPPQSLAMLHPMHPGQESGARTINPVSGSSPGDKPVE